MLQQERFHHADSRLLSTYQFGAKSAIAAVNLSQIFKDSFQQQQSLVAQSPLNSEGSTSATPPQQQLECSTSIPQEICAQSSVWSEYLNGASNSFMGDNMDNSNVIPSSTSAAAASTGSSAAAWWAGNQELQVQWNQAAAHQSTPSNPAPPSNPAANSMPELEGGEWSPGQLGCLPPAPEVNEQLSKMAIEQTDYSSINTTSLVDHEMSSNPTSWGFMGSTGNEEPALEGSSVEGVDGLQEALFSKTFIGQQSRLEMLADHHPGGHHHHHHAGSASMIKKSEPWEISPLKGSAAAFEMEELNKQQQQQQQFAALSGGSPSSLHLPAERLMAAPHRMDHMDNWPMIGSDAGFGNAQFAPGKIKQEMDVHFYNPSTTTNNNSSLIGSSMQQQQQQGLGSETFKTSMNMNIPHMLGTTSNEIPSRWASRLPAMLAQAQVLPSSSASAAPTKPANLFGSSNMMRSFGSYNAKPEPYKVNQREQSSMSQHSSITSQHSYDSKDSSKHMMEENREVSSSEPKRGGGDHSDQTFFKRPRMEQQQQQQQQQQTTPTLPFKATTFVLQVRKEKLGERITALQQLVAPFGKTDTASVLLEAIGYIKFLHEQVQVLSTPYMKNTATNPARPNEAVKGSSSWSTSTSDTKSKDSDEPRQDLRSRGLCLVPISCTLQVANDNGADFWTPNIGGGGSAK